MEVLSKILAATTGPGSGFKYHPNCLKMKLTHLCFADDLLIFSEANQNSIGVIKATLAEFEELSGLKDNPSKSFVFCSGISDRLKQLLLQDLQIQEGKFPVRYLGVPLISTRLIAADCEQLLDRITSCISSWLSRNLSYAEGCSCSPLFYIVCKFIGLVYSSFLRRL
jgi:hypothetical protein